MSVQAAERGDRPRAATPPPASDPSAGATGRSIRADAPRLGRLRPTGAVALVAVLVVTAVLVWLTAVVHDHNENHLLALQVRQAAAVVAEAVPNVATPLDYSAELAASTDADVQSFRSFMTRSVGPSVTFVSASLWQITPGLTRLVTSIGASAELSTSPAIQQAFFAHAASARTFAVVNLLRATTPRLGYAAASRRGSTTWLVYAESPLHRHLRVARNSAFSELTYALYIGRSTGSGDLLGTSADHLPIEGRLASVVVPFGNTTITIVATPNGDLGSGLLAGLPWILGVVGVLAAAAAALTTSHLVRRRMLAEALAGENQRLYREQRTIAAELQHALLPQGLPVVAGMTSAMQYIAGSGTADIGGDWYDVIPLDESHVLFAVGDVSGRGIEAATVMARLHFAIRAYALQGDAPEDILRKLGTMLDVRQDGCFATVLCGLVGVADHSLSLANAGHLPPLLLAGGSASYVETKVYPPIGMATSTPYRASRLAVPAGSTVVAFTDGLVERKGESIDEGLERVRRLVADTPLGPDALLARIVTELVPADAVDDTAILALRWES